MPDGVHHRSRTADGGGHRRRIEHIGPDHAHSTGPRRVLPHGGTLGPAAGDADIVPLPCQRRDEPAAEKSRPAEDDHLCHRRSTALFASNSELAIDTALGCGTVGDRTAFR